MSAGLKLVLARVVERPIYVIVADGLWTLRSFSDVALRLAGTSVRAIALGPYTIPPEREKQPEFVEFLRRQMIEGLARLRDVSPEKDRLAAEPQMAG